MGGKKRMNLKDAVIADKTHGYERRDLDLRMVAFFSGGLLLVVLSIVLFLKVFLSYDRVQHEITHSLFKGENSDFDVTRRFPAPRLQMTPQKELGEFRAQEDRILGEYGWEDKEKGLVRVPIEEGIRRFLIEEGGR
jgi:hypothetical protein